MLALDMARIEAGLMLLDVDYVPARKALIEGQTSSPFELDLDWAVEPRQGAASSAGGARRARRSAARRGSSSASRSTGTRSSALYAAVGLPPQLPAAAWRTSVPLYAGGKQVGYATSGTWSPLLKKYIALAHLQRRAGRRPAPRSRWR